MVFTVGNQKLAFVSFRIFCFFNKGRTHLFRLRQKNTKTRFVVDVMD